MYVVKKCQKIANIICESSLTKKNIICLFVCTLLENDLLVFQWFLCSMADGSVVLAGSINIQIRQTAWYVKRQLTLKLAWTLDQCAMGSSIKYDVSKSLLTFLQILSPICLGLHKEIGDLDLQLPREITFNNATLEMTSSYFLSRHKLGQQA